MNALILPFKVLRVKYRNNGRQDITATLNGTVNGGKTYFNQSSQELIPNGSTVTEKGRIRDRSWSARRGQTPRRSPCFQAAFSPGQCIRHVKPERNPILSFSLRRKGTRIISSEIRRQYRYTSFKYSVAGYKLATESPRCASLNRDTCYQGSVKRDTYLKKRIDII